MKAPHQRGPGRPVSRDPTRKSVRRSVDLDKPLDRRVQRLAAADGRSVANWLTRAIEREVIRQESLEPQS